MSARPDTWMPIYWGDYVRDTGHLNAAGHGAYLMLIKHYWCTGSPLRNDDDELWRIACCDSKREWLSLKPKIVRLFQIDGEVLRHKRIDRELARGQEVVSAKSAAGKKGAEKRWHNSGENVTEPHFSQWQNDASAMAEPSVRHRQNDGHSPSPSPSSSLWSEELNPKKKSKKEPPTPTGRHAEPSGPLASLAVRAQDSAEFQQFWQKYPRREGKGAARKAFAKARKSASFEAIMGALDRTWPTDPRYIPHPATWLNQQRWLDEIDATDPVLRAAGLDENGNPLRQNGPQPLGILALSEPSR